MQYAAYCSICRNTCKLSPTDCKGCTNMSIILVDEESITWHMDVAVVSGGRRA